MCIVEQPILTGSIKLYTSNHVFELPGEIFVKNLYLKSNFRDLTVNIIFENTKTKKIYQSDVDRKFVKIPINIFEVDLNYRLEIDNVQSFDRVTSIIDWLSPNNKQLHYL